MDLTLLIILFISLLFSAYFSGMEIAFISSNKLKLELIKKQGHLSGRILSKFMDNPSHFIGTSLVGNNITLVIFGLTMAEALKEPLHIILPSTISIPFNMLLAQTIITTLVVLVFGEFIPKILFRLNAEGTVAFFTLPFRLIYYIFYPLVVSFLWISRQILNIFFRMEVSPSASSFTTIDLEHFIKEADKKVFEEETNVDPKLLENALILKNTRTKECMVPRTEIVGIELNEPIRTLQKLFTETKLSRIVVYEKNIDHIIGYAHHLAFLEKPEDIRSIVITLPLMPESMPADELLNVFIKERRTIALVVDEFGGTAGIITLEDVIEEIFGEIQDEFDDERMVERKLSENEFVFSARLEIDYLNDKYFFELPKGEYETLAGMIISYYENIPERYQRIKINNFEITVIDSSNTKIERIRLKVISKHSTEKGNPIRFL